MKLYPLAAVLALLSFNTSACSPPPPIPPHIIPPREASPGDLFKVDSLAVEGVVEGASDVRGNATVIRVRVVRWLKGTGPAELELSGFYVHVATGSSCPPGGSDVVMGKRHLLVLDPTLSGNRGNAFSRSDIDAGRVTQVSWVLN